MSTPTPMEDAMLLHAARALPPDVLQSQWPAVAQCVARATCLPQRTPEETKRRFEALAMLAFSKPPPKIYTLPATIQQRPATSVVANIANGVPPSTTVSQPVATAPVVTVSDNHTTSAAVAKPQTTAGTTGLVATAAKLKRKRESRTPRLKYFSLDDDEALLQAIALVKPGLSRPQWQLVADRVSAETLNTVSLKRCRSRYQFLMGIPRVVVVARFGVSAMLVKLVQDAQADYVARKEKASAELEPPEEEDQLSLSTTATNAKSTPAEAPRVTVASTSTAAKPQAIPPSDRIVDSEPRTTTPTELPPAQTPALSITSAVAAVSASSASDSQSTPTTHVADMPAVNSSTTSAETPSPVSNAQTSAVSHQQTELSLQDQIQELKAMITSLGSKVQQTQDENAQLKRDVQVLQETVGGLSGIKHEVANLRSRLEGNKREVEWIKAHSLMQSRQAEESQKKALENIARKMSEAENVVEAGKQYLKELLAASSSQCQTQLRCQVESLSKTLTEEIGRIRAVQNGSSKAIQAVAEEVSRVQKADVDLFNAFAETFTGDITSVRETQEENSKTIQEFAKALHESEKATRQRQAIFYEMVEAETLAREKLASSIEKWKTQYENDQESREESLLWFQDEIHDKLHKLHNDVEKEFTKVHENAAKQEDRVKVIEATNESSFHAYEDKLLLVARSQEETRRHSLDQYVQITFQLHDLRDTMASAMDKERRDRSQDFRTLLQHVQQLVALDLEGT